LFLEAKRLQETDKEKAEKLLARHKRKEKKRREKALLAVLKERARIERRFKEIFKPIPLGTHPIYLFA